MANRYFTCKSMNYLFTVAGGGRPGYRHCAFSSSYKSLEKAKGRTLIHWQTGSRPQWSLPPGYTHHQLCSIHTAAPAHSQTTRPLKFPSRATRAKLMSSEGARDFVDALNPHQREHLQAALDEFREDGKESVAGGDHVGEGTRAKEDAIKGEVKPPTWVQLRLLCYQQALPFLGFGFLDNFVMITVGEYIDLTIGAALTISTMAAAGLGNLISDLAGLGLADRVEALCRMIGIPNPQLSSAQLHYRSSRWMGLLGRCLGITVGCLLGMVPLLWFDHQHKLEEEVTPSQPGK